MLEASQLVVDRGRRPRAEPDREQVRERIEASGTWTEGPAGLILAIESDGRLVGEVQARAAGAAPAAGCVRAGDRALRPDADRGRGLGADAVAAMIRYLFEDEGATGCRSPPTSTTRRCAGGRAARVHVRRACCGGVHARTSLGPRDYAMYGITRDDYEDVKAHGPEQADDEAAGGRWRKPTSRRSPATISRSSPSTCSSRCSRDAEGVVYPAAAPPRGAAPQPCATRGGGARRDPQGLRAGRGGPVLARRPRGCSHAAGRRGRAAHRRVHLDRAPAARDARRRRSQAARHRCATRASRATARSPRSPRCAGAAA